MKTYQNFTSVPNAPSMYGETNEKVSDVACWSTTYKQLAQNASVVMEFRYNLKL